MRPVNPTSHLRLPARLLTLLVVVAAANLVATGAVGPAAAAAATAPGSAATDVETARRIPAYHLRVLDGG